LDWSPSSLLKNRAAVAITKIPAKVPVTDPRYGGSILINPGGPGGSGIYAVIVFGKDIQTIVDSPMNPKDGNDGKYFDIIGFDPRGVNNTIPRTSCLSSGRARDIWKLSLYTEGLPSNTSFSHIWSRTAAYSETCSLRLIEEEEDQIGRYVNTPVVVEDMMAIVEALGEWKEKKVKEVIGKVPITERDVTLKRTKWRKGKEKILYWGLVFPLVFLQYICKTD
jgi:hypothetical protein